MMGIVTFMVILGRNKRGASRLAAIAITSLLATIAIALILSLSGRREEAAVPNSKTSAQLKKPVGVFESASNVDELSERIRNSVKRLEYPDEVAERFAVMAMDWKDELGCPVLILWEQRLLGAHQDYQRGKISRNKIAKVEEHVLQELFDKIQKQFSYKRLSFELSDVIQNRQADCLGYSQLMYLIGNAVGLSVRPIDVLLDPVMSLEGDVKGSHIACIIDLSNGRSVMADVMWSFESPSGSFKLDDYFIRIGNYWQIRDKNNFLGIHKKIRLLDKNGLIAAIYYNRGAVYASKGEHERAILEYNKAIEKEPGSPRAYNNRGNAYSNKGEYDRAIVDYNKAIEIDPEDTIAYINRGNTYAKKGELDRAILDYNKAIEVAPGLATAYNNRGAVYAEKDEHDHAILDFTKAVEINPKYAKAYYNRGLSYIHADKSDYDQAILDFTKVIEINPEDTDAYYNRGKVCADKDEHDRAILDYTKAIEINPKHATAYVNRGVCYYDKGEHNRAILDFEKAIEIDREDAIAYLNRGEVYAELGKPEEARKDLLKAVELDPQVSETVKDISERFKLDLNP